MKTKRRFWKIILVVLLYSLVTHWKDVKQGFLDGIHDAWQKNSIQKSSN
ncbi:MAG: hypothetical protein ACRYFB_09655 [Janthinobacterium lividum]